MYQRWPSPRVQWQNHRYAYPNQDLRWRCSERWRSGANQIVKPGMGPCPGPGDHHGLPVMVKFGWNLPYLWWSMMVTPFKRQTSPPPRERAPLPRQLYRRQRARDHERGLFKTTIFIHIWKASHIKSQLFWGGEQTGQVWLFDPSLFETRWG